MRRVAVTGMGVVSPLGNSVSELYASACAGRSGIGLLQGPIARRLVAPLAATARFEGAEHFDAPKLRMLDRFTQFALVAARQALADAGHDLNQTDRSRAGVFVGTGMGGSLSSDEGYHTLASIDAKEPSASCKPFSKDRSGMVLGEGAAMLVLEPWDDALARGAPANDGVETAAVRVVFGARAPMCVVAAGHATRGGLADPAPEHAGPRLRPGLRAQHHAPGCRGEDHAQQFICLWRHQCGVGFRGSAMLSVAHADRRSMGQPTPVMGNAARQLPVIASVARQFTLACRKHGLPRCARNDGNLTRCRGFPHYPRNDEVLS